MIQNHNLANEINLRKSFQILINSYKLIIIVTLIFLALASSYAFSKKPMYISSAKMVIGYGHDLDEIQEDMSFYFQNINLSPFGKKFFELNSTANSIELAQSSLKLAVNFLITDSYGLSKNRKSQKSLEIETLENELLMLDDNGKLNIDSYLKAYKSKLRIDLSNLKIAPKLSNIKLHNEISTRRIVDKKSLVIMLGGILGLLCSFLIIFIKHLFKDQK